MKSFDSEIQDFKYNGTYEYQFDSVGNFILNENSSNFNQVYISFPIKSFQYNDSKILSFYDVEFREFIPSAQVTASVLSNTELEQRLQSTEQENSELKIRLDGLIKESEAVSSPSEALAIKQVILDLRKALGEGRVDSDFSLDFPYTKITQDTITDE